MSVLIYGRTLIFSQIDYSKLDNVCQIPFSRVSTAVFMTLTVSSPQNLAEEADAKPSGEDFNIVYRAFREASESGNRKEAYELAVEALSVKLYLGRRVKV